MGWKNSELEHFQRTLNDFVLNEVPNRFKRQHVEAVIFMWKELTRRTPVAPNDSQWRGFKGGFARSNWRVSINKPLDTVRGEYGRPKRVLTEQEIRDDLSNMKLGTAVMGFGNQGRADKVYIYNNVPYIKHLENGSSTQAPIGMVEPSIEATKAFVARRFAEGTWKR